VTHMLLYLASETFVGDAGRMLADEVRRAMMRALPIVLVHENDKSRGGCPFETFFKTTPQDLVDNGLYGTIAIAAHAEPHRSVSCAMVALELGASAKRQSTMQVVRSRSGSWSSFRPRASSARDSASEQVQETQVEMAVPGCVADEVPPTDPPVDVTLTVEEGERVGVGIVERGSLIVVRSVDPGTAAEAHGVQVGAVLQTVNGEVLRAGKLAVMQQIATAPRPLKLVLVQDAGLRI